jgi:rhodanese-related sulfurtransferase
MSFLEAIFKEESALNAGVAILTVNMTDTAQAVEAFMVKQGYNMPALLGKGSDIATVYNILNTPTSFFIDRQGIIRSFKLGPFIDANAVKAFFSESTVTPSVTAEPGSIQFITAPELAVMYMTALKSIGEDPDFYAIDIRDAYAYYDAAIQGAINIPPVVPGYPITEQYLIENLQWVPLNKVIIFYGQQQADSGQAMHLAQRLLDMNLGHQAKNIRVLEGGLSGWLELGYPLSLIGCG